MSAAVFSFAGIVIGASLQYFFTRHLDKQRHHLELRTRAYIDYLKCVCEQANLAMQPQSRERHELYARTADTKCRICLYGSPRTVAAFAEFERLGAQMTTHNRCAAFTRMVAFMRADSARSGAVEPDDLQTVLMGTGQNDA